MSNKKTYLGEPMTIKQIASYLIYHSALKAKYYDTKPGETESVEGLTEEQHYRLRREIDRQCEQFKKLFEIDKIKTPSW